MFQLPKRSEFPNGEGGVFAVRARPEEKGLRSERTDSGQRETGCFPLGPLGCAAPQKQVCKNARSELGPLLQNAAFPRSMQPCKVVGQWGPPGVTQLSSRQHASKSREPKLSQEHLAERSTPRG